MELYPKNLIFKYRFKIAILYKAFDAHKLSSSILSKDRFPSLINDIKTSLKRVESK